MKFNKWQYRSRVQLLENNLLNHEVCWLNRLSRFIVWNSTLETVSLDDYVAILSEKGLVNYRQELGFIIKFIGEFEEISSFTRRFFFRLQSHHLTKHRRQILPTSAAIEKLLARSDIVEYLFILSLSSSGRRSIDFINLKSENVRFLDGRYYVTLEKDKMNSSPVRFSFEWDKTLKFDSVSIDSWFGKLLQLQAKPFLSVNMQRLRRRAGFHLHGLRNRKSLQLIRADESVEEVKSIVGWSSDDSFIRYTKLNLFDIKKFDSLDSLILYLNL